MSLGEVMGGPLTKDQQSRLWKYLDIVLKPHIPTSFNYKTFSGIAALVERIFCQEFISRGSSDSGSSGLIPIPPKSEIEVADFDRLHSKLSDVRMKCWALKDLLVLIKESGVQK